MIRTVSISAILLFSALHISKASHDPVIIEVTGLSDTTTLRFVQLNDLYSERWDTLAQPKFWQIVMRMPNDSGVLNIGSTRQIIEKVALDDWKKKTDAGRKAYRDSVKKHHQLPADEHVYLTSGKSEFYCFEKAIPGIDRSIGIFQREMVDPFYAQAILLIESPGKLARSPAGAYGSFQLMPKVARLMGLTVSRHKDERKDFDKSAAAAAKLLRTVCIPHTNNMLDARCIPYEQNELWYRLLVLHVYHAGAGNMLQVMEYINPEEGMDGRILISTLWKTEVGQFRNASQNYSQLAIASLLELDRIIYRDCENIYHFEASSTP